MPLGLHFSWPTGCLVGRQVRLTCQPVTRPTRASDRTQVEYRLTGQAAGRSV